MNLSRKYLRQQMREKRSLLSPETRAAFSEKLTQHLLNLSLLQNSQHIAAYIAHHHEIDPSTFVKKCFELNKTCYLPVLDKDKPDHLIFVRYRPNDPLVPNRYDIPEPIVTDQTIFSANLLDLVLIPLVAFDSKGDRLGMGKGYYDRTFAFMNDQQLKKPALIGLAYSFQQVEEIVLEPWDVPLHGVVTEEGFVDIFNFSSDS
jgi:5-formyltetrahydrofolate cyclo-ligase